MLQRGCGGGGGETEENTLKLFGCYNYKNERRKYRNMIDT
jgi:hypothetical protein